MLSGKVAFNVTFIAQCLCEAEHWIEDTSLKKINVFRPYKHGERLNPSIFSLILFEKCSLRQAVH